MKEMVPGPANSERRSSDELDKPTREKLAELAELYQARELAAALRKNDNMFDIQKAGLGELGRDRYTDFLEEAGNKTLAHTAMSTFASSKQYQRLERMLYPDGRPKRAEE